MVFQKVLPSSSQDTQLIGGLTAAGPGFQAISTSNIEVQAGQIVREGLHLKAGASTTMIEVNTEAPLPSTDTATIGRVVTKSAAYKSA